jgi:integrase
MPSGAKSYVFQYRIGGRGSPTRRYTIGKHGTLTPDQARKIASDLAAQVARGIDPMEAEREARKAKAAEQLREAEETRRRSELAFDAYAERFLTVGLDSRPRPIRARTREGYESALRNHVIPVLGSTALPDLSREDIDRVLDAIPRSQPSVRRVVFAVLRMVFDYALKSRDLDESPIANVDAPKAPASRDRVLSDSEISLALRAADAIGAPFGPIYSLLFATGQRREEAAGLQWQELDRATATWTLPAERAKNGQPHIVPLNRRAIAALDSVAGQDGEARPKWPSRGLVFTSTGNSSVSGYSRAKARLDGKMLEIAREDARKAGEDLDQVRLDPWRLHDARRTLATAMQKLGVRFEVTEAILNHRSGASRSGVAAVYQRYEWEPEKREALEKWSNHLDGLLAPPDRENKVVPFRAAKVSPGKPR